MKEKDPSSSQTILEEQYIDVADERLRSTIVYDSSYLN